MRRGPPLGGPPACPLPSPAYFCLLSPCLPFLLLFLPFFLLCLATLALCTLLLFTPPLATSLRTIVPGIGVTSGDEDPPLVVTVVVAAVLVSLLTSSVSFSISSL